MTFEEKKSSWNDFLPSHGMEVHPWNDNIFCHGMTALSWNNFNKSTNWPSWRIWNSFCTILSIHLPYNIWTRSDACVIPWHYHLMTVRDWQDIIQLKKNGEQVTNYRSWRGANNNFSTYSFVLFEWDNYSWLILVGTLWPSLIRHIIKARREKKHVFYICHRLLIDTRKKCSSRKVTCEMVKLSVVCKKRFPVTISTQSYGSSWNDVFNWDNEITSQ